MMASIIVVLGLPKIVGVRLDAYTKGYDIDPDPETELNVGAR